MSAFTANAFTAKERRGRKSKESEIEERRDRERKSGMTGIQGFFRLTIFLKVRQFFQGSVEKRPKLFLTIFMFSKFGQNKLQFECGFFWKHRVIYERKPADFRPVFPSPSEKENPQIFHIQEDKEERTRRRERGGEEEGRGGEKSGGGKVEPCYRRGINTIVEKGESWGRTMVSQVISDTPHLGLGHWKTG